MIEFFSKKFGAFNKVIGSPTAVGTSLLPVFIVGFVMLGAVFFIVPSFSNKALPFVLFFAPVWMPILFVGAAWREWIIFRHSDFIASQKYVLLEIKPPRTHSKTPIAMEAVLSGLHLAPGESTWYSRSILGKMRPWWSLEIASIEGQVHFFIWTREAFKRNIETNFYSQYPGVQIVEVPDYTRLISGTPDKWGVWGCDFDHTKPDPYPIKTYIDYGLDKPSKEYEQTDPLANLIEFMSSFGPGEQIWMQLVIRVHKGDKYKKKNKDGSVYTWKDAAKEAVQEIRISTVGKVKYKDVFTGEMRETEGFPNPTKGESDTMAAIERNVGKLAFDVGARVIYLARPDKFAGEAVPGILGLFKQFSSESFNGFKPTRWLAEFSEYPWEPFLKQRQDIARRKVVDAFRRRQYFYEPYSLDYMVMSTEELATLYHVPSASIETPTLSRVTSATSTAPANIPT